MSRVVRWLAALALGLPGHAAGATPRWSFETTGEIRFLRMTPSGTLVVSAETGLHGLDPATGEVRWRREDIRDLQAGAFHTSPLSAMAVLQPGSGGGSGRVEALDLETGKSPWAFTPRTQVESSGFVHLPHRGILLHAGELRDRAPQGWGTARRPWLITAVDASTGATVWSTDSLHEHPPQAPDARKEGTLAGGALAGHQPPVSDTDSTLILYWSRDGLVKVHLGTGRKVWSVAPRLVRGKPSAPHSTPMPAEGFAPMLRLDTVLYVPVVRTLHALGTRDGRALWDSVPRFRSKVVQMEMTPRGLLVRGSPTYDEKGNVAVAGPSADLAAWQERADANTGRPFLDLLDPATGRSVWGRPLKLRPLASAFTVRGDTVLLVDRWKLLAIDLRDGSRRELESVAYTGVRRPVALEAREAGILIRTAQTLSLVGWDGVLRHHGFHEAPAASGWARAGGALLTATSITFSTAVFLASGIATAFSPAGEDPILVPIYVSPLIWKRYHATRAVTNYTYFLTNVREEDGKRGPGLVKVHKDTGKVVGKLLLGDRTPEFELDPVEGRLFFKSGDRRIDCHAL